MVIVVVIGSGIDIVMIVRENGDIVDYVRGIWIIVMMILIFLMRIDCIGILVGDFVIVIFCFIVRECEIMIIMIGYFIGG